MRACPSRCPFLVLTHGSGFFFLSFHLRPFASPFFSFFFSPRLVLPLFHSVSTTSLIFFPHAETFSRVPASPACSLASLQLVLSLFANVFFSRGTFLEKKIRGRAYPEQQRRHVMWALAPEVVRPGERGRGSVEKGRSLALVGYSPLPEASSQSGFSSTCSGQNGSNGHACLQQVVVGKVSLRSPLLNSHPPSSILILPFLPFPSPRRAT